MAGGKGNDTYIVDGPDEVVLELPDEGRDRVVASFSYTLPDHVEDLALTGAAPINGTGNDLDNLLIGNGAANLLSGEAGADTLDGGPGADTLVGGTGNDTYIDEPGDLLVEMPGGGIDTVRSLVTYRLQAHFENLVLLGNAGIDGTGNNLDNLILGNGAGNVLAGGFGADTLIGGGGADRLVGGVGDDNMEGGNGSDVYVVDAAGDVVIEHENGGFDRVTSFITYALPDHVENLLLLGTDPLDGFGNALGNIINGNAAANRLVGGDGNDRLDGGLGADTLEGGTGNDVYIIDDAGDLAVESPGEGVDTVQSRISYTLTEAVENLLLVGAAALDGIGNAENNRLTGNAEANLLRGLDGNDTLNGLAGADTLEGGAGNDRLVGGPGDDMLIGGEGEDSLFGGAGADSFRFAGLSDAGDSIADFAPGQDLVLISTAGFGGLLPTGVLAGGNFAFDSPDAAVAQFVYSAATGVLAWDEDGSGTAAAVTLATLISRPALTAGDILVIA
jgi:Ca2+-binding RTX toxin-like protein